MPEFVHLHVHTDYSLLDGCAKTGRLMKHTAKQGMKAIALTDHGSMFGAIDFYNQAKKNNIKPIIGCEVYLVIDHKNTERPQRGRVDAEGNDNSHANKIYHMGLLAQDNTGYHNLVKIVSDAHLRGMYYKPRTDLEHLAAHAQGLIGFSGCLAGVIPQHLLRGDIAGARKYLDLFVQIFTKDRFIIELQDHGIPEQQQINPTLLKLAKEYGLMAVATNDSHYVEAGDTIAHDILLCIQTGAKLADTDRLRFDVHEFFVKTPQEMEKLFGHTPELLSNTVAVAERCDVQFKFGGTNYPTYKMTAELSAAFADNEAMLRDLCARGLSRKYKITYDINSTDPKTLELSKRLDYEISIIKRMGFIDYFLIVQDFINWAKQNGIPVGPGRGSGAGSLVAYTCGITNVDPIRFGLLFERFLNPERVSPPDFDIDFCIRRREEVVDYVRRRYGVENVANIITFGTFGAKMVIRDICRVKDLPFVEADRLAKLVPEGNNPKTTHGWTLTEVAELPEMAAELKSNPLAQEIYKHGTIIEGMVRSTGKHAAGIVITEKPLVEYLPLTLQEGAITTQYPMGPVGDLGLLKMDFLGLKNLTVINDAVQFIRVGGRPDFDIDEIPLDDPKTYEVIAAGRTPGIFQLESGGMQSACRQVGVSNIDDINAVLALYRPGPMAYIPEYAKGKKDPASVKYPHPLLEKLLKETYGIIVYQEQVMESARILAGYTLGGADLLRRAMGKKKPEEMEKQKAIFVAGCEKTHGIEKEKALEVFALLEKFASYGFNKSHSAAYAVVSYQTAYLKANYPVEFMAAVLGCEIGSAESIAKFIAECSAMHLQVLGPDINESGLNFTPVGRVIRFGLGAIKGVGEGGASKIIEERKQGAFADFRDFLKRIDSRAVNRRVIENLIKTGAFDSCGDERAYLLGNLEQLLKENEQKDKNQTTLFDMFGGGMEEEMTKTEPLAFQTRLQYERELLGFYLSGHPLDDYPHLCEEIDTASDLRVLEDRKYFRVCGVVSEIQKRISKKDNQPWALFKFSTRSTTYEMSLFAGAYADYGSLLTEGAVVVIVGQARRQNDELRFSIETVKPLEGQLPGMIRKLTFVLAPQTDALPWLKQLKDELLANSGETAVNILCQSGGKEGALAQLPESLRWRLRPQAFRDLCKHPAVSSVKATAVEFVPPQKKWGEFKKKTEGQA
jgi:DNA polymerase III subunit alpha